MIDSSFDIINQTSVSYEDDIISKVAWYYYHNNLTQQEIADVLCISRMKVIKLMEKAKSSGVIQFRFRPDVTKNLKLEENIKKKFGLKGCFVVPTIPNIKEMNVSIGKAAALFLLNRTEGELSLNVSFGDTTEAFMDFFASSYRYPLSFISLTGGVNRYMPAYPSNVFRSKLLIFPTPLYTSSADVAEMFKKEKEVEEIKSLLPLSSATVLDIGVPDENATLAKLNLLSESDRLMLKQSGAVAEIAGHFLDKNGNVVSQEFESRTISIPPDELKNLDNVIGIAGGMHKLEAIRSVLAGKYLNVLITDEETALELEKD